MGSVAPIPLPTYTPPPMDMPPSSPPHDFQTMSSEDRPTTSRTIFTEDERLKDIQLRNLELNEQQEVYESTCQSLLKSSDVHLSEQLRHHSYIVLKRQNELWCQENPYQGDEDEDPLNNQELRHQPFWRRVYFRTYPEDKHFYLLAPPEIRRDPSFCPIQ